MASYTGKGAPSNGTIYVSNLPEGTDDSMLAEHFGTIGLLKVWVFSGYYFIFYFQNLLLPFAFISVEGFASFLCSVVLNRKTSELVGLRYGCTVTK